MLEIEQQEDVFTFRFKREDISEDFLRRLFTKLRIEQLLEKGRMTEEQAWQQSEEIKESWWNENKDWILKKIGITSSESNC